MRATPKAEFTAPRGSGPLRFLDRNVGVPLLWLLGLLRRRRPRPAAPAAIGILKAAAIGDTVLLAGVVADLRAAYPRARIVFAAGGDNAAVARMLEGVDEVVAFDVSRPWRGIAALRSRRLDMLIDFGSWPRIEALVAVLAGARYTLGFRTPGQHRHYAFDQSVEHSAARHELDNYRALAAAAGAATGAEPRLRPAAALPDPPPDPYAVLHLWPGGTRSELKEWPSECWADLADALADRGLRLVLTGAPADAAGSQAFAATRRMDRHAVLDTSGRLSLAEVVSLLAGARSVVSVNTGIAHIAAAVGAPTVVLNGPTSSRRWGIVGARVANVDSPRAGCGFLNLGAEYDGNPTDCMQAIDVERVLAAVDAVTGSVSQGA